MDRLTLRQYVLGFLIGFMALGITLLAMTDCSKDTLFAVSAVFAPIMLLLGKGVIDSDESNEDSEE